MTRRCAPGTASALALIAAVAISACGEDLTVTPVRNLERPSDMDFVCLAGFPNAGPKGELLTSARPMSECYLADSTTPVDGGLGSQLGPSDHIAYGLFTNSARSEVGAINMLPAAEGGDRLIDLDRRQPGYNMVPVGTLPERLTVSDDGCATVTANRGSCDLSVIDNTRLVASAIGASPSSGEGEIVRRLRIRTGNGQPFWAVPGEVAIVPKVGTPMSPPVVPDGGVASDAGADGSADAGAPPAADAAAADAAVADAATADAAASDAVATDAVTGARQVAAMCAAETPGAAGLHQAVVTFPGCDLVALIDLNTGDILDSLQMRADGTLVDFGRDPVCSAECPGGGPPADAAPGPAPGAGAGPGGGRIGVSALALHPEAGLAYVAANRSPVVAALTVTATELQARTDIKFELAENPVGVTRLRLSRDPYRRLEGRNFVGPVTPTSGSYLYAFAQDGSVRVVSLERRRECDVNVDVGAQQVPDTTIQDCFPIGVTRNVLARGPGLRPPPSDPTVGSALPVDIAFTHVDRVGTGFLLTSRGDVFHVYLGYQAIPGVAPPPLLDTVHSVRRDPLGGFAQSITTPTRNFSESSVAFPTRIAFNTAEAGPFLQSYPPRPGETEFLSFPRPLSVPGRQSVVVRWEGILPFTQRTSGRLSPATEGAGSAGALTDEAATFCSSGVEPGDVVAMVGCDEDRECDLIRNEVCYRAAPGARGACLPRTLVTDENWARLCQAELGSRRRYEVKSVSRTRIELQLKPDEVPRPGIAACTPNLMNDAACQPDAAHRPDPNVMGDRGFQCVQLPGAPPRCLKPCGVRASPGAPWQPNDELCRAGFVCADMGSDTEGPVCVEAPPPRSACTPADAHYQVQAGRGYTVASSGLPFFSRIRERQDGVCEVDPARPAQLISRIPLAAPACTTFPPGSTAMLPLQMASNYDPLKEGPGGNPCLFRPGDRSGTISAVFENAHFRLVLNNIDTYIGDAASIQARIDSGFRPVFVSATRPGEAPNLGVRIVTGPMKARTREAEYNPPPPYLFVVDQSRTTSLLSRGKIMRINPYAYLYPPGGHFDSLLTGSLYPIQ